jgi:hypothetical protein
MSFPALQAYPAHEDRDPFLVLLAWGSLRPVKDTEPWDKPIVTDADASPGICGAGTLFPSVVFAVDAITTSNSAQRAAGESLRCTARCVELVPGAISLVDSDDKHDECGGNAAGQESGCRDNALRESSHPVLLSSAGWNFHPAESLSFSL